MTTADPETRIADLKARWEADPTSRVFVQLADEYRRAGNTSEAIEVLEKGLATQPNYVTAQAALGRCHLAAGDAGAAIEVLSRVMEQDPSHPLAGRLLVEAHLQTGDLEEAGKRLEHYRMMADSGEEVEDLEQRLEKARRERDAENPPIDVGELEELSLPDAAPLPAQAEEPAQEAAGLQESGDDVFDLGSFDLSEPTAGPFDLPAVPETAVAAGTSTSSRPLSEEIFQLDAPAARAPEETGVGRERPPSLADEPFGDLLAARENGRRIGDRSQEEIFDLGGPDSARMAMPEPPVVAASLPQADAGLDLDLEEEGVDLDLEPDEAELEDVEPEDAEPTKKEEATVTLGQLYMAQGHRREAARIFRSVLERDPANEVSRRALAELEGAVPVPAQSPAVAREPEPVPEPESAPQELAAPVLAASGTRPEEAVISSKTATARAEGITERKISALEDYLQRLRRMARS